MSVRRFASPALPPNGGRVVLDPGPSHHLLRVTGIAPGEQVELYDGSGQVAVARLVSVEAGLAVLDAQPTVVRLTGPDRWLLLGVLKGAAQDTALRMATELGVAHIVPVLADRSIARGDRGARWERVVASAVAQCGRATSPALHPVQTLPQALWCIPDDAWVGIAVPGSARVSPPPNVAAVLVGPEGGWTDAEVAMAVTRGAHSMGLGRWTLRADTAAAAALTLLS